MNLAHLLRIDYELNFYLVTNGVKSATLFEIPLDIKRELHAFFNGGQTGIDAEKTEPKAIDQFKMVLRKLGVPPETYDIKRELERSYKIKVGKDRGSLVRLLTARTDREIGLALGFPQEAVDAFKRVIGGERRDGQYVPVQLARAKQAGLELPTWPAYISFVPDQFDLVHGNVSSSSEKIGRMYQDFVKSNNEDLARRVEQEFLARKLPAVWEKRPDGSYSLTFDYSIEKGQPA